MSMYLPRLVRFWHFDPDQTQKIAEAIAKMGTGCRLELEPYERDGEPALYWRVTSPTATAGNGEPPGGNDSHLCPPIC